MLRRAREWFLLAALTCAPGMARAQSMETHPVAGSASSSSAGLVLERQRLRSELERINGEIDTLKRESRGLRDDYRLRNRMADAEALARRLTEVDARLPAGGPPSGGARGAARAGGAPWPAAPEAQPTDDRATLEAKADILADQARRLSGQADLLAGRVSDLRGRQELRRRAGQLERDPFSQLEQPKRRLAASAAPGGQLNPSGGPPRDIVSGGPPVRTDTSGGPPMTVTGTPTGGPPSTPLAGQIGLPGSGAGASSQTAGSVEKAQPSLVSPASSPADVSAGSVSAQFRGILDASTLAEIRRLEVLGAPAGGVPAMERALSALRARAAELTANAAALRSRAKVAP